MKNNIETAAADRKSRTYRLAMTAVMTAVICILAPFSIPIGPVPVSLANLAIFLSVYLLGWKAGTVSLLLYLLLGIAGLPVFSGFSAGPGVLIGPTAGYIAGYIPMAVIAGIVIERYESRPLQFCGMLLGTAVCYALGTAWFCILMKTGVIAALSLCVFPFIPGDIVKMFIAMLLGGTLNKRMKKAGLL